MNNIKFTHLIILVAISAFWLGCERDIDAIISDQEDNSTTEIEVINIDGNEASHEESEDYTWNNADVISIEFDGNNISSVSDAITIINTTLTISQPGTYSLSGVLTNGQVIVNSEIDGVVRIILDNVALTSSSTSPLVIENAEKTVIILADNSENTISDASEYTSAEDGPNAAIYSADDLTIYGNGSLTVKGNYQDGITSKDGLLIASGTLNVNAIDDGIRGKDYLIIQNGNITVNAGGDGLKSDNEVDEIKGYIMIEDGVVDITSGGDGIAAITDVLMSYGSVTINAGGGSDESKSSISTKGIKAGVTIEIVDGSVFVDAADDAIHCDMDIVISGGLIQLASGDDGIHSEYDTYIKGGEINITKSYEGIESALGSGYISGGTIYIVASDDGINISAGGSSGGGPGRKSVSITDESTYALAISGGYIFIDCEGDGLDSNDLLDISGGTMLVNSAQYNENSALDYDGSCVVSGGLLLAIGSSQMSKAPGSSSSQYSFMVDFNLTIEAGNIVHFEDENGTTLLSYQSIKPFSSIVFSSAAIEKGSTVNVYIGGSSTGTFKDGVYTDGTYSNGTKYGEFTISSAVTTKTF